VNAVLTTLVAIIGLGFLILVHELGHFIVAKATGMRVEEFSLGFGRFLVSKRIGETVYGISMFPVGGYVRVTGMHQEEFQARVDAVREQKILRERDPEARLTGRSAVSDEEVVATPLERRYYAKPLWQRLIFIVSGVSMNVVAAFVILFFVGLQGYVVPVNAVDVVEAGSPAAAAGVMPGDEFVSVAGVPVSTWEEVQAAIKDHPGETVPIVVQRAGVQTDLQAVIADKDGVGYLGVGPATQNVASGPVESLRFAASRTYGLFALTFKGIGMMITGEASVTGSQGLAGPVGIVTLSSQAVRGGYFLSLLAFISIQLAIMNMLPLLPLDGGHFFIALLEKVTRRRFSLRVFERVSLVGIALFLVLALVATGNDIGRLFSGNTGM
jgi:regulator of sigma E protease